MLLVSVGDGVISQLFSDVLWKNRLGNFFCKEFVDIEEDERVLYFDFVILYVKKLEGIEDFNNKEIFQ